RIHSENAHPSTLSRERHGPAVPRGPATNQPAVGPGGRCAVVAGLAGAARGTSDADGRPRTDLPAPARPDHPDASCAGSVVVLELRHDLVRRVEVGVDVLYVVAVLERVDEAQDLARPVGVDLDLLGRVPDRV